MQTIYVSPSGSGDGSSDAKPAAWAKAHDLVRAGDKLLLQAGGLFDGPLALKGINGLSIGVYGQSGARATLRVSKSDALTFLFCDDLSIADLDICDPARNPAAPGFVYCTGQQAIHFNECNRPKIADCSVKWFKNGLIAEGGGKTVAGGTIQRVRFAENYNDRTQHSNAVFFSYQGGAAGTGWQLLDCDFDTNGWHPAVPQANGNNWPGEPATMFNHDIYNHDSGPGLSGQYAATRCTFRRSSSSGPTGDAGAILDRCVVEWASNDGSGAPNMWVGGRRGADVIRNCTLIGPGLRIDSQSADVLDNTIIPAGCPLLPITVDLPHDRTTVRAGIVNIHDNTIVGWSGEPIKIWQSGGGAIVQSNNRVIAG